MPESIPEKDWKYLRSIHDELLALLCKRINQRTVDILLAEGISELDKYRKAYRHIKDSDDIVAECFDDWQRSNIRLKLISLHRHKLLSETHYTNLTDETQSFIKKIESL